MHYKAYLNCTCMMIVIAFILMGCTDFGSNSRSSSDATISGETVPQSVIDTLTAQILTNMHLHAWNPNAMTKGVVTGGLYINWKMDNPSITNVTEPGSDGNPQHNHDPQVDLLYLTALSEYRQLHSQNQAYEADLNRAITLVLADFQNYNLPKGWIYFYLLENGLSLNNAGLIHEAYIAAENFYKYWYDPTLRFVYDRTHKPVADYSVDHTVNCGAALIDAGMRWHQPDWVSAGEKTIDHAISAALDPQYHLFYESMIVSSNGQDKVEDYKARPTSEGQAVTALLTAYTLTHRQQYLDVADKIVQSMFETSGLWDKNRGGFYTGFDLQKGVVITSYKETRDQSQVLIAILHYDQVVPHQFTQQVQQLVTTLTDHFYRSDYHGYFYRMTPDFQIYVTPPGEGVGVEDYFTTEAMGTALDSLQQTELDLSN